MKDNVIVACKHCGSVTEVDRHLLKGMPNIRTIGDGHYDLYDTEYCVECNYFNVMYDAEHWGDRQ